MKVLLLTLVFIAGSAFASELGEKESLNIDFNKAIHTVNSSEAKLLNDLKKDKDDILDFYENEDSWGSEKVVSK